MIFSWWRKCLWALGDLSSNSCYQCKNWRISDHPGALTFTVDNFSGVWRVHKVASNVHNIEYFIHLNPKKKTCWTKLQSNNKIKNTFFKPEGVTLVYLFYSRIWIIRHEKKDSQTPSSSNSDSQRQHSGTSLEALCRQRAPPAGIISNKCQTRIFKRSKK